MKAQISISDVFELANEKKEKVLIIYMTAGFPDLDRSFEMIREAESGGADIIELGIPFSDPVADGPTIQYSSEIAIAQGATLSCILERLENALIKVPVIIMTYLNPLLSIDRSELFKHLVLSRVSGLVIPDLPVEMAADWLVAANENNIDLIMLAAPTSPPERLQEITLKSQGIIYCVSVAGTTGARQQLPENLPVFLHQVRSMTDKSIAVGFGISTPDHISILKPYADGFIVGSRIINAIRDNENIYNVVAGFKTATRR